MAIILLIYCNNFIAEIRALESYLESNSLDIVALCETNLDDSMDSGNLSVMGRLCLIQKDSVSHLHALAIYVKEGLHFAQDLSLENSMDCYLCFQLSLFHSVSSFSSINHLVCLYPQFLILFHLT